MIQRPHCRGACWCRVALLCGVLAAAVLVPPSVLAQESARMHADAAQASLYPELRRFLADRRGEFDRIPAERKELLEELGAFVRRHHEADKPVDLIFVCTHNSRRSHMSQLWAQAAADMLGLRVTTYSGGTEDTAFNPRAVAAIERAGFRVEKTTEARNPIYHVRMADDRPAMTCFSKAYDAPPNPDGGFGAVMVCDDADEACPVVDGAAGRFAIPFVDPKVSDNTPAEAATYDERCAQIAREMLYAMTRARG